MRTHRMGQVNRGNLRRAVTATGRGRSGGVVRIFHATVLLGALVGLLQVATAEAQWRPDGIRICSLPGTRFSDTALDASGNLFITWMDERNGGFDYSDIYAQLVSATGQLMWGVDGMPICTAQGLQGYPVIIPDEVGGAIVTWTDGRAGVVGLYAQRISADGTVHWTTDGVALCTATGSPGSPAIVSDSAGGAIIAWSEYRGGTEDIYAQRISTDGTLQWAGDGVALSTAAGGQSSPEIVSDGAGGAIVTWSDQRNSTEPDIYAQRISADGTVQWAADGVALCTATRAQQGPKIASDGAGGAIIAWQDSRNGYDDIYAQHINADGAVYGGNGVALCVAAGYQSDPQIVSAGATEAIVTWRDERSGSSDIYARLYWNGAAQWPTDGVAVCTAADGQSTPRIVSDGAGGAIITWCDGRNGNPDVYIQRISHQGAARWTADGVGLCTATGGQVEPRIVSDGAGGAVVAWSEGGATLDDPPRIYVRRTPASGVLRAINVNWGLGGDVELLNSRVPFSGLVMVGESEEAIFQVKPNSGYFINSVTLDGVSLGVVPNLDFSHPTANHTSSAVFSNGIWSEQAVQTPIRAYTTVAFPLTFANDSVRVVLDELGPFDDTAWRLARWNPESSTYQFAGQGLSCVEAGAGYWLITANGAQVQADGTPLTTDTVGVKLKGTAASGWNQIGNPYRFPVADTALRVLGPAGLVSFTSGADTLTDRLIWEWKGGSNYDLVRTIQPRKAYWVRKTVSAPVSLVFPNWSSEIVGASPAALPANAEWTVALTARQGEASSMRVLAGRWARSAQSAVLRLEPPPGSPDGGLSLRIRDVGSGGAGRIADFTPDEGPWNWDLELRGAEAPGEVVLECEASGLPVGLRLWLTDEVCGWNQEIQPGQSVTLAATAGVRRLRLHAAFTGESLATPTAGAGFAAAYPNPFRDRVGLVFRLEHAEDVRVDIHDVLGRRVRRLETHGLLPGEHVVAWDGRDDNGRPVPAGVYLARCPADDGSSARRLLRLR